MSKPWLEKSWLSHRYRVVFRDNVGGDAVLFHGELGAAVARKADCDLAAAAPEMCRALLMTEWGDPRIIKQHGYCFVCRRNSEHPHDSGCVVDAALTKAGLDTQEKRDEARKEMGV